MPSAGRIVATRYRLERCLGAGAMGSVWAAVHLELDAPIAIKFAHPTPDTSKRVSASRREARAAARLRSPNVVQTFDFGMDEGDAFIAMELLIGASLKARLESEGRIAAQEVSEIVRQTAIALDLAHRERIVHRDIKPSNLFITREGGQEVIKVLDFGIAKWLDADIGAEVQTESTRLVGSAAYMSPEQARGQAVDHRSDIWALAVVAYEMLVGARPFAGGNIPDTLSRICAGRYDRLATRLGLHYIELDQVFARALQLDPARRFQSAGEFARALASAVSQTPLSAAAPMSIEQTPLQAAFGRVTETASYRSTSPVSIARPRRGAALLAALGLVSLACAALFWFLGSRNLETPAPRASTEERPSRDRALSPILVDFAASSANVFTEPPASPRPAASHVPPAASSAPQRRRVKAASSATKVAPIPSQVDPLFGLEVPAAESR
jgi:eukaryotic-like serine/threonine-protein kinase